MERIRSLENKEEIDYITSDSIKLIKESKSGLERICKIVSGLKKFSHMEGSGARATKINDEIENTLELLSNELKYQCQIELALEPVREIYCNPNEITQVFVNIIMNAAQAMPSSGGRIRISTHDDGTFLKIRIEDNGTGMTPQVMENIFQPFFTTKPVGKGTGLGLAISFGIVERHGGTINVESTPGKGSTFCIQLPYPGMIKLDKPKDLQLAG